jgi:hypothetical protein
MLDKIGEEFQATTKANPDWLLTMFRILIKTAPWSGFFGLVIDSDNGLSSRTNKKAIPGDPVRGVRPSIDGVPYLYNLADGTDVPMRPIRAWIERQGD